MTLGDDALLKKTAAHEIGQDLSLLSVSELDARIALLHSEIERLAADRSRKEASRSAADAIFKR
jgi:uncharacterized small protein (DUF1192 family)